MKKLALLFLAGILASCGGDEATEPGPVDLPTIAATSDIEFSGSDAGVTPFIQKVRLEGVRIPAIKSLTYVIEPRPGSVSKPVRVSWSMRALKEKGYLQSNRLLVLPVIGLYAGRTNEISIALQFSDGSSQTIDVGLTTGTYSDPRGIYDAPVFVRRRDPGSELGFDFFALKPIVGGPVIVDTDGELRWVGVGIASTQSSLFTGNEFVIGDENSPTIRRLELDGEITELQLPAAGYLRFHHTIDPGKHGLLGQFDTITGVESTVAEFTLDGRILKEWDFAQIISDHMRSMGDDPAGFVRPGVDWFHSNATTYDPGDDSLIVSSRENFVIKVDYQTGEIIWILGDPDKYWWSFPSLRAKALTLDSSGLHPIGQHAVSLTSDGLLLLFNNGFRSLNQPVGAPTGASRPYSSVSAYRVDAPNLQATEEWRFDYAGSILSTICSSVYEAAGNSLLINYSFVSGGTRARVVGLDATREVVFDYQYGNTACNTSWNASPVPLDDMRYP